MAAPLFLKKGYDNVSIDEIIGVVGGSKATIYAWFGGKEGLFEAVVRQECRDVVMAIHADTGRQSGGTVDRDRPVVPGDGAVAADPRIPPADGFDRPDHSRRPDGSFFETGPASAYSIVAAWIAKQQKDGRIAREDPYRLAVLFLDMLIGEHQLSWLTGMPRAARRDKIDETVRIAVKVFLRGCARR